MDRVSQKGSVRQRFSNGLRIILMCVLACYLSSCTTLKVTTSHRIALPVHARITAGPIANYSDTPMANKQIESMLTNVLFAKGFDQIIPYPRQQNCEKLLFCPGDMPNRQAILTWARQHHIQYVLTGAVHEWRYKVGLDGEPVVGASLTILDAQRGQVLWSGLGSAIGSSRQGLDVIGQEMLGQVMAAITPLA
jgi:hypothetical protein